MAHLSRGPGGPADFTCRSSGTRPVARRVHRRACDDGQSDRAGLRESGVASALAAGCRRNCCDSAAVGIQLFVASGDPNSRRRAAAGRGSGARDRHLCQGQARRSAARVGRAAGTRAGHARQRPGGLRLRRARRPGGKPELPTGLDHVGRHRHGREPPRHLPRRDDRAQRRRHPADSRCATGRDRRQPAHSRHRQGQAGRRSADGPCHGADAVHPGDLGAFRRGRQQRRGGEPGQLRRRGAVGGRPAVLVRQGPVHPERLDDGAEGLQQLRAVRPNGARLGDGIRGGPRVTACEHRV